MKIEFDIPDALMATYQTFIGANHTPEAALRALIENTIYCSFQYVEGHKAAAQAQAAGLNIGMVPGLSVADVNAIAQTRAVQPPTSFVISSKVIR
jgi:hypothetical protein